MRSASLQFMEHLGSLILGREFHARFIGASAFIALFAGSLLLMGEAKAQSPLQVRTELETRSDRVISSYRPSESGTEKKPAAPLLKEPEYRSKHPIYGKIVIATTGQKREFVVVMDEVDGQEPRVYVDANGDRDLTNDGSPEWNSFKNGVYRKSIKIKAGVMVNGREEQTELPYSIYRFSDKKRQHLGVLYYRMYARTGSLTIKDKDYNIMVSSFDNSGVYSKLGDLIVVIDMNRDGKFDRSEDSVELFNGTEPFNIDGETYRISKVSELGDTLSVIVSKEKVELKIDLTPGHLATDFLFETIDGRKMKLSDFRGKVVMLDFWATWCGPCRAEMPDVKEVYNHFDHSKFEIIGISLDGGATRTSLNLVKSYIDVNKIKWPVTFDDRGWENSVAKGYRVHAIPRNIVIDQNGVIRLVITAALDKIQVEKLISGLIDNGVSAEK